MLFITLICSSRTLVYIPRGHSGVFLIIILSDKPCYNWADPEQDGDVGQVSSPYYTFHLSPQFVSTAEAGPLISVTHSLLFSLKINGLSTDDLVGVPALAFTNWTLKNTVATLTSLINIHWALSCVKAWANISVRMKMSWLYTNILAITLPQVF